MTNGPHSGAPELPPQVIRRGDEFVVHNVDISKLSLVQRAALGLQVRSQVQALMRENGEATRSPLAVDERTGPVVGLGIKALSPMRRAVERKPHLLRLMETDQIASLTDVGRLVGDHPDRPTVGRRSYGKGDLFDEAIEPLRLYLKWWREREFLFTHLNPAEAKRRLKWLAPIAADLQEAIKDLEMRSHSARLSMPSEKERKGTNHV